MMSHKLKLKNTPPSPISHAKIAILPPLFVVYSSRSRCLGAYSVGKLRREFCGSVLVLARWSGGGFAGTRLCLDLDLVFGAVVCVCVCVCVCAWV